VIFPLWMLALIWAYSGAVIGNLYGTPARPETGAPEAADGADTGRDQEETD